MYKICPATRYGKVTGQTAKHTHRNRSNDLALQMLEAMQLDCIIMEDKISNTNTEVQTKRKNRFRNILRR